MDRKILLVDDEKDIADLIEEVLRQDSFENIKKVYTGMDAVQVCREYPPDVVVLDIMLPDIDGIEGPLTVGGLALDRESSRIYKNEKEIDLTGREFLLLYYLMENADKIISKERLYEQVWGEYSSICDNTIMVHIRHIREKIEDTPSTPKQLITIKGLGYKLKKRTDYAGIVTECGKEYAYVLHFPMNILLDAVIFLLRQKAHLGIYTIV